MEQVLRTISAIRSSQEDRKYCPAAILDVAQAFDIVWREGVTLKVKKLLPAKLDVILESFLLQRKLRVKYGCFTSCEYNIRSWSLSMQCPWIQFLAVDSTHTNIYPICKLKARMCSKVFRLSVRYDREALMLPGYVSFSTLLSFEPFSAAQEDRRHYGCIHPKNRFWLQRTCSVCAFPQLYALFPVRFSISIYYSVSKFALVYQHLVFSVP